MKGPTERERPSTGRGRPSTLAIAARSDESGAVLVVATNCNGGIKEVLAFDRAPDRWALWHHRCPTNPEFTGSLPPIRAHATTEHRFDPCALLTDDTRSEMLPAHRQRMRGGGWCSR